MFTRIRNLLLAIEKYDLKEWKIDTVVFVIWDSFLLCQGLIWKGALSKNLVLNGPQEKYANLTDSVIDVND